MPDLTQLYRDIILQHNKSPLNYGPPESYTGKASAHNPLCGDEVTVYWNLDDQNLIDIRFQAQGCAISRASASMMTRLFEGKNLSEARELFSRFARFLNDPANEESMDERLGDLVALSGVRRYPSRIKCATLAWHALLDPRGETGQ